MCLFDYIFLNTTYRPGYHHKGFMATDAIEHIQVHQLQENIEARTTYMNQRCMFSVVLLHASGLNTKSSRPEVFCRIFTKFTGKHLCQSLFFSKVTGLALGLRATAFDNTLNMSIFSLTRFSIFSIMKSMKICCRS